MTDTKQVIVMRNDLNMRKGKMIAQGAHASIAFLTKRMVINHDHHPTEMFRSSTALWEVELEWLTNSFTKVCVYVNSDEELFDIVRQAKEAGLEVHLIQDAGKTEFKDVPTYTCCAIGPDYSDKIDKVTGHLPLL